MFIVSKMVVKNLFSANGYSTLGVIKEACIESQFISICRFKG